MSIGVGVFLLVVGAILTWAVNFSLAGIDIHMIGLIFLAAGLLTTLISLVVLIRGRRATAVVTEQTPTGTRATTTQSVTSDPYV